MKKINTLRLLCAVFLTMLSGVTYSTAQTTAINQYTYVVPVYATSSTVYTSYTYATSTKNSIVASTSTKATTTVTLATSTPKLIVSKPAVQLTTSSSTIQTGKSATITWISLFADSCVFSWAPTSAKVAPKGIPYMYGTYLTPVLSTSTLYTMTCRNAVATTSKDLFITVVPKVATSSLVLSKITLIAQESIVSYGSSTSISWNVSDFSFCIPSWAATSSISGVNSNGIYKTPPLIATTTYSLLCKNREGYSAQKSVMVTVKPKIVPPLSVEISTSSSTLSFGSSAFIVWSAKNSTSCTPSWTSVATSATSGVYVSPALSTSTSFSVTCKNRENESVTKSVSVIVIQKPVVSTTLVINLKAASLFVAPGATTSLNWSAKGALSCNLSWSPVSVKPVSPGALFSGTYITPALTATTTYSVNCFDDKGFATKSVTITYLSPRSSSTRLTAKNLGLIINDNDPDSVIIGNYYKEKRGIPEANIVRVSLPVKAQLTPAEFAPIRTKINASLPSNVQAVAVAWTNPSRVNCNSITSVIATDYNPGICTSSGVLSASTSPYYNSFSYHPYTDFKIRPAMMLAGKSVADVKALIDRGVSSDATYPKGTSYIMNTTDKVRSLRATVYPVSKTGKNISPDIDVKVLTSNAIASTTDTLFYFQGLATVGKITTNKFPNGAIADHLTSYGGKLTDSSQMSILEFISGGVTGSYGTVSEPYATGSKFPDPVIMMTKYTQGDSLIEAYWKSVSVPYQGIFVGEPLANPWTIK